MIALLSFFLTMFAAPFKSKSRLAAENAALRHQLIVLQRKVRGRVRFHKRRSLVRYLAISMVPLGPEGHHEGRANDGEYSPELSQPAHLQSGGAGGAWITPWLVSEQMLA